ncbi:MULTISPECIES: pteridine reductase [unclassified Moraxella]|uniref:pteridine reductase n=1 Tax=unclassified Moraxella TaxID=2685852 RepID=UPI00359DC0DE
MNNKVVLVTGGARRIGHAISTAFHHQGYDVIIHHHHSHADAQVLANTLNAVRPNSAKIIKADLSIINNHVALDAFKKQTIELFGRLDVLVHNASSFYPTALDDGFKTWQADWDDLFLTNAKAPLFLSLAFKDELAQRQGVIISLLDIHARDKPFIGYPIYNMAKSAHLGMVQSLALELAPCVRVNGVSPGVNIFPDDNQNASLNPSTKDALIQSVPLGRIGTPADIAQAVAFLAHTPYITGQVIAVDGGRSLTLKGG